MSDFKKINYQEAIKFLINKHYSGRKPNIKHAFGVFNKNKIEAVCTFGIPASPSLCVGILGQKNSHHVIELNRLCRVDHYKKPLSQFVAFCLKKLKKYNYVIVSYADEGMDHVGTIYQALNFIYTGKTKIRTDKFTEGNKHSRHYDQQNNHLRKVRTSKHRYVYFACDKQNKKRLKKSLNYSVLKYPKGKTSHYKLGQFQKPLFYNQITGKYFHSDELEKTRIGQQVFDF